MLSVRCSHCGQKYHVAPKHEGKRIRCMKCQKSFKVVDDVTFWRAAVAEAAALYGEKAKQAEQAQP